MIVQRQYTIVKYWLKIVHHEASPLVREIYNGLYHVAHTDDGIDNWDIGILSEKTALWAGILEKRGYNQGQ